MNARERVLTIRLIEKAGKHPDFIKRLGIETVSAKNMGREKE